MDAKKITPSHTKHEYHESSQLEQGLGYLNLENHPTDPSRCLNLPSFCHLLRSIKKSMCLSMSFNVFQCLSGKFWTPILIKTRPRWKCLRCLKTAKLYLGIAQQRRLCQLPAEHWSHGYAMATMVAPMFRERFANVGLGWAVLRRLSGLVLERIRKCRAQRLVVCAAALMALPASPETPPLQDARCCSGGAA